MTFVFYVSLNILLYFAVLEFLLEKPYSMRCYALDYVTVWTIKRRRYKAMQTAHPHLYTALQTVLLKSLSITHISDQYHLHPSPAYHIVFTHNKRQLSIISAKSAHSEQEVEGDGSAVSSSSGKNDRSPPYQHSRRPSAHI